MNELHFTSKKMGKLEWADPGAHYRYVPRKLNPKSKFSNKVLRQLSATHSNLGELKASFKQFSKDELKLFSSIFFIKEAQISLGVEGIHSTIFDIYLSTKAENPNVEKRRDAHEIINYQIALKFALEENKPISEEQIKKIHKILLEGPRGRNKSPGEYRNKGVLIGGTSFDNATFVPPSHKLIATLMQDLIKFNNSDQYEILFKIALSHYQFETIHPFLDGNGRAGRIVIILNLIKEKIITYPILYLSGYLFENRDSYINLLYNVSAKGDIEAWYLFFLKALEAQTKRSLNLLKELRDYKKEIKNKMRQVYRSNKLDHLIENLFIEPIFSVKEIMEVLNITQPSAWIVIKKMLDKKIIFEYKKNKKKKMYVANEIIKIIENTDRS